MRSSTLFYVTQLSGFPHSNVPHDGSVRMLQDNPQLVQLRMLQAMGGNRQETLLWLEYLQRCPCAPVSETLAQVIQRADELAEFVAIYWKDGRVPLSDQVKKGFAAAFPKFDEYQLAEYDRGGPIKLRDVLFLCHAKPRNEAQAEVWKKPVSATLTTPDTWEVALSSGADKRPSFHILAIVGFILDPERLLRFSVLPPLLHDQCIRLSQAFRGLRV